MEIYEDWENQDKKYHQQSLADSTQRRSFEGMAHIHEALESDGNDQPDGRVAADVAKERNELTGVLRQRMNVDAKDLLEPADQKSEMKHTEVENTYGQKIHVRWNAPGKMRQHRQRQKVTDHPDAIDHGAPECGHIVSNLFWFFISFVLKCLEEILEMCRRVPWQIQGL